MTGEPNGEFPLDSVLVCGLGSLGQYCVALLKQFGVPVNAIEAMEPTQWEIPNLPQQVNLLVIGDCSQSAVLEQAQIHRCRAILLVTSNERINLESAFAARSLNPQVRLVVQSSQERLNQLLSQQLGNFVAFEPHQLPATAFALAALGGELCGLFPLEDQMLRVSHLVIDKNHRWCDRRLLHELNTATRRLLSHTPRGTAPTSGFYHWEPDARVRAGDTLTYIEIGSTQTASDRWAATNQNRFWQRLIRRLAESNLRQLLRQIQQQIEQNQPLRVGLLCALFMVCLLVIAMFLYRSHYPETTWQSALNVAVVLALGGYGDLFGGGVTLPFPLPWWLHLFSLGLTITGTVFIGILYALLTERVLASRFQFLNRRPPVPRQDHIILVGLGRLGQRVAHLLRELKQPVVGISTKLPETDFLPDLPLVVSNLTDGLERVHLPTAKSVVVLTDDEVSNLEIALLVHTVNPDSNLVIRTLNPRFSDSLGQLLPYAKPLGAYALAAEVFATAAFGENVLNLFRLENQTTLVTEYQIEDCDTLHGLLLGEVAYGYGVVPILHQRQGREPVLMPAEDLRVDTGDRLVVLATIAGLRRVEQEITDPREWSIRVEKVLSGESAFEGGSAIARISGCDLGLARNLMNDLPATLDFPLYKHQALRLARELNKLLVQTHVVPYQQSI